MNNCHVLQTFIAFCTHFLLRYLVFAAIIVQQQRGQTGHRASVQTVVSVACGDMKCKFFDLAADFIRRLWWWHRSEGTAVLSWPWCAVVASRYRREQLSDIAVAARVGC